MKPFKIAVLSDTHGRLPRSLVEKLSTAQEIWHLGDVTSRETIEPLVQLPCPLAIVEGNCDPIGLWPNQLEFERGGTLFRLQHYPPSNPIDGVDVVLHGHLHRPIDTVLGNCRILSPGAVNGPRQGSLASFAWIEFDGSNSWHWNLETV